MEHKCKVCNLMKEDFARIVVEIVDKKTRQAKEFLYGEIICMDCLETRYKGKTKLRLYV